MLGITKYADRLDQDLDLVIIQKRVKSSQRNWIGRSESEIEFRIKTIGEKDKIVFTWKKWFFSKLFLSLA